MDDQLRPGSVLFLKESNDWWVALWLETNIAAQGQNIRGAWLALKDTIEGQLTLDARRGRSPLAGKQPAPQWYWQAYDQAKPLSMEYLEDFAIAPDQTVHPRQYTAAA